MNKHILLTELGRRYKGLIIWIVVMFLYALLMVAFFDEVFKEAEQLTNFIKSFGDGFLAVFAIEAESFTTFKGFFTGEYISASLLLNAVYAAYLGSSVLAKEISDKSLSSLIASPASRLSVYFSKYVATGGLILLANLVLIPIVHLSVAALVKSTSVDLQYFVSVFLASAVFMLLFYTIAFSISVIVGDGKGLAIAAGISVGALLLNFLKSIKEVPAQIQYINPYHYLDLTSINRSQELPSGVIVLIIAMVILLAIGAAAFKRKDLNI